MERSLEDALTELLRDTAESNPSGATAPEESPSEYLHANDHAAHHPIEPTGSLQDKIEYSTYEKPAVTFNRRRALAFLSITLCIGISGGVIKYGIAPMMNQYQLEKSIRKEKIDALYKQGVKLEDNGKIPEADSTYRQILALDPDNSDGLWRVYRRGSDLEENIIKLRKAVRLDDKNVDKRIDYGLMLCYKKNLREGLEQFEYVVKLEPKNSRAIGYIAICWRDMGYKDESEKWVKRYVESLR